MDAGLTDAGPMDAGHLDAGPLMDGGGPPATANAIPPTGGQVSINGSSLDVPGGALPAMTNISVSADTRTVPGYDVQSDYLTFGPDGLQFQQPVRVTIPTTAGAGYVIYWGEPNGTYQPVPTILQNGSMVAFVTHFTGGYVGANTSGACAYVTCPGVGAPTCAADGVTLTVPGAQTCVDETVDGGPPNGVCVGPSQAIDCSMIGNGTGACSNGNCVVATCNAGFGDCDQDPLNGCEAMLATSQNNCGACGNTCASDEVCNSGACVAIQCTTAADCPPTATTCASSGSSITTTFSCAASVCVAAAQAPVTCGTGTFCVGGEGCVQCITNSDCGQPTGACGATGGSISTPYCVSGVCMTGVQSVAACPAGSRCLDGPCEPLSVQCLTSTDCPTGLICKNQTCIEPTLCMVDSDCAAFPNATCDTTLHYCAATACASDTDCPPRLACSNAEVSSQPLVCGAAVSASSGAQFCTPSGSATVTACGSMQSCIGGACVAQTGSECALNADCTQPPPFCNGTTAIAPAITCSMGYCVPGANDANPCAAACFAGKCVSCNTAADCSTGQTCNAHSCVQALPDAGPAPMGCTVSTECFAGQICVGGVCVMQQMSVPDGGVCPAGTVACSGRCADTNSDPENCGSCGVGCGLAGTCIAGACSSGGSADAGVGGLSCAATVNCWGPCTDLTCQNACVAQAAPSATPAVQTLLECVAMACPATGPCATFGTECQSCEQTASTASCATEFTACYGAASDGGTSTGCVTSAQCPANESCVGGVCVPQGSGPDAGTSCSPISGGGSSTTCDYTQVCGSTKYDLNCTASATCICETNGVPAASFPANATVCNGTVPAVWAQCGFGGTSIGTDAGTSTCGLGQVMCGQGCTSLASDPSNCGMCGLSCGAGVACNAGVCSGSGAHDAGLSGASCSATIDCWASCTDTTCQTSCLAAADPSVTPSAQALIDCVAPLCPVTGVCATLGSTACQMCEEQAGATTCLAPDQVCFGTAADGGSTSGCVTNANCPSGASCVAGVCQPMGGTPDAGVSCSSISGGGSTTNCEYTQSCGATQYQLECTVNATCVCLTNGAPGASLPADGTVCNGTVPALWAQCGFGGASSGHDGGTGTCGLGQVMCSEGCTSLSSDPQNCGSCGTSCAAGVCSNGVCAGGGSLDAGAPGVSCATALNCAATCSGTGCQTACAAQVDPAEAPVLEAAINCVGGVCPLTDGGPCATQGTACESCEQSAAMSTCAAQYSACVGGSSGAPDAGPAPTLESLMLTGPSTTVEVGETLQLTVLGLYSNGSKQPVPGSTQWQSSNPSLATVSPTGLVSGVSPGGVTISASLAGSNVPAATLGITVEPWVDAGPVTCPTGLVDCQAGCTSLQNDPKNCGACNTVCPAGDSCIAGACTVAGSVDAGAPACGSISAGGSGASCQFSQQCGANQYLLQCTTGGNCTCMTNGLAGTPFPASPTACGGENPPPDWTTCQFMTGSTGSPDAGSTSGPTLTRILIDSSDILGVGVMAQLDAMGEFSDGTQQDVTATVTWSSQNPAIATITTAGFLTTIAPGSVQILATSPVGGPPGHLLITVEPLPDGGASCAAGQAMCHNGCTSLETDPANCGQCEQACAAGSTCSAGVCVSSGGSPDGGETCGAGLTMCASGCANTQDDVMNCGACGALCATGDCVAGACVTPMTCGAGLTSCATGCTDTTADPDNCGACGLKCPSGMCAASACVPTTCGAGLTSCSNGCANTMSDPDNCGACGVVCLAGDTCVAGACETPASCGAGLTSCATGCTDTTADPDNCGACGLKCPSGMCAASACVPTTCGAGLATCPSGCADTMSDPGNCGACGVVCPAGDACAAGACVASGAPDGGVGSADGGTITATGLRVTPSAVAITAGQTTSVDLLEEFSDNSSIDVTASAQWVSKDSTVATVNASGVITAVGAGQTTVIATYQAFSAPVAVNVQAAPDAGQASDGGTGGTPCVTNLDCSGTTCNTSTGFCN